MPRNADVAATFVSQEPGVGSAQASCDLYHLLAKPAAAGIIVVAAVPNDRERERREFDRRFIHAQTEKRGKTQRHSFREGCDHGGVCDGLSNREEMRETKANAAATPDAGKGGV